MTDRSFSPVLLVGAGRMGQALIQGWRRANAFPFSDLLIRTPSQKPECDAAAAEGAALNPPDADLANVRTVVLCVKPQKWREIAPAYDAVLPKDAVIVSVLVGTRAADLEARFGGRRVARVLPTTGVARAEGVTSLYAADPEARARAAALFAPISAVVELEREELMDAAGAVSASAPAYLYAFTQALEDAGVSAGLPVEAARTLARGTIASAAALMAESGAEPADLIAQVASPGGTTRAALGVLTGEGGLEPLLRDAVAAAVKRAQDLAG
ncbi:pyrroline-5-carboxylate reductase [Caulobacter sp. 17J80-11]|uniref:pyrroline-5-carboxylate reductase n=1 Tax=Caulobacter sp. 17J80-11 TaxID=2763502 RepID=UPI0016537245|nr:pyrroline-5-carboxylate reductase [Caulobacter sp. 17J80-11]MBC6982229.1 pyrroline-5-carboxylate reductase [Caulobacter sp. 17J80-11]